MLASNIEVPPASALDNMTLVVDYTPDSSTVATSVIPGNKIDLTATAPVAVAGTTQQEIVQDIGSQLRLSSTADIIAPAGWVISYSTDGTTWTTTAPTTPTGWNAVTKVKAAGVLVSEGADSSGRQIASTDANAGQPTTGQFPTTTGATGDGWNVFFDDAGHIFNVWHHNGSGGSNVGSSNQSIDCHLRTGQTCGPSWPFKIVSLSTAPLFNMHTSEQSNGWFDTVDDEIWFPTVYTFNGVNQVGFGCIKAGDVSLVNKWCGGTPDSSFISGGAAANVPSTGYSCGQSAQIYDCTGGLAQYNGRLFTWAVNTGDIVCVDIRENGGAGGPCSTGGLIDFGANLTNVRSGNYRWRPTVGEWGGRIYGSGGQNLKAVCIDAITGASCAGWTNPRAITKAAVHFSKLPTAQGGVAGACFSALGSGANGGFFQCFDATGTDISSSLTTNFTTKYVATYAVTYDAYAQNWETYGSRMYWGDSNWAVGQGKIYCWDFALDSWCRNWTASGIADTNYQLAIDPTNPYCIWSNSNDGIIQTYDAYTGAAGNCALPAPTAVFDAGVVVPRMACSSVDAIQGWRSFVLTTTSTYTSATLTVKNSAGTAITGWSNIAIPGNNTVDLSTLAIADSGQSPTFTVSFTGRTTSGDVSARITAVGGAPQLCLRPLAPLCPTGTVFTPGQLAATTTTVTADGNATAGTTITPLNQASATVNIDATTPSSCVSSLSGTTKDTANNVIAGATVTLTDSVGVTLLYPADYGNASLRGQPITTTTDASGNYSFNYLTPGAYAVKFDDVQRAEVTSSVVTAGNAGTLANRTSTDASTTVTSLVSKVSTITLATPGVIDGVYTVMPTLTKRFFPSTLAVGEVGSLIFTFVNVPGNPAKSGLGFVDTLPSGLVVDTNNNLMTTCPGGVTPSIDPSSMSTATNTVTVTGGSLTAGVASCDYSVSVKATAAGTYTNGAGNITTTGVIKEANDTLVATTPSAAGGFLCDTNMYHITNKQLYRESLNQTRDLSYEVGPKLTTAVVNAIGFNSADGYIYGIATTGGDGLVVGHLVRYGSDGVPVDMGAITGSMTAADLTAIRGGDTDDAGNLIVGKSASTTSIYSINIATRVSTTITLSVSMYAADLAYSNGKLYSLFGNTFFKVVKDPAPDYSWAVTTATVFSNTVSGDAIWSNGFGEVIVSPAGSTYTRTLYRTSNPSAVAATTDFTLVYPITTNADDGAMCHSSPKPTAFPDTTVGPLNTPQTKNVLANDTTPLTAAGTTSNLVPTTIRLCNPTTSQVPPNCTVAPGSTVTVANVGVYSVSNAGEITFTPVTGYTGTPTPLAYQVADGLGNVGDSTYTPTITSTTPVAMNDVSSAAYDTNQTINILANDYSGTLANIDPTTVKICTTPTADSACNSSSLVVPNEGTYTVNADGTVTFDPLPTFQGTATPIKYVVLDGQQQQTSATITPTVNPPAAPVATPDTKSVIPGGTLAFTTLTGSGALATSGVGLNTSLTCLITPASSPDACDADGVVTVAGVGTYTLDKTTGVVTLVADPAATAGTKTALKYQVTDITGQKATSTLTPIIPTPPAAVNDTSTGAYDTNQMISPLLNDSASSPATLVATSVKLCATTATANSLCDLTTLTVASQGTFTVNANGTVTFDPLPSFTGVASPVKYVVADTTTQLASATITPTVSMPAVPVATAQSKTVIPGGTVAFTMLTGASGLATSGVGFDTSLTCLITPASVPDTCDADGVVTVAGVGTYTLDKTTGVVTLVADPAATAGTKTALKYQVTDSFGQKATSTLTPVVPVAPVAVNDTSTGAYDVNQTISVLTNDAVTAPATLVASTVKLCATTSTPNTSCTLDSLTVANEGTYTANANGTVTFDPLPTFKGTVSTPVKYVVADSTGQVTNATITPTVSAPATPVATPQGKSVNPGETVAFTTLTGTSGLATSAAGFNTSTTCLITPASSPAACDADGIVTITGQGTYTLDQVTGIVTYAADPAATVGAKTAITYQVQDITGQKVTSTLTPTVPPAPVATNDTSTGAYDTNQTITILTNDTAGAGATLVTGSVKLCATTATVNASCSLSTLTVANEGTYTVNANGTVTFDPLPTFKGVASAVKYIVADSTGRTDDATIIPTVTAPAVPVATAQSKSVIPGASVAFTTLTGTGGLATSGIGLNPTVTCLFTPSTTTCDADGIVTIAGQGTYTLDQVTGIVTYAADPAATAGTKTAITYQVQDITGQKATSTLTPVIPVAPVATADTSTGAYDVNQTISVLTNDTVTAPATLVGSTVKLCATTTTPNSSCTLTSVTVAGQGTYTANANGTVTFDPLPTFKGTASPVKYVVADSNGQVTGANITPTVTAPAAPVATAESKSVIPGGTVAFTTLTGTGALATSGVGLDTSLTCLITPGSTPDACDTDGVVTVVGVGTYTLNAATGVVTLVADAAATAGTKTALKYQVTDITGQKVTSTLTPVVPPLPVAVNDTSSGAYDTNQTISPFTNDTATTPATIVASSVKLCATTATANTACNLTTLTVAGQGTYTVNANGTVTFDPLSTFTGAATAVKYVVADSNTQLAGATITPTVALPTPPVATADSKSVIPGGTVAFTTITGTGGLATSGVGLDATVTCLLTPSTTTCDADGIVTVAGVGTYTLNKTTGVVTLVADSAATAGTKAALSYRVTDTFGQTATSTLTPVVPPLPVATNDTSSGAYDTNQVISPFTNDTATSPATIVATSVKLCATAATANASCNLTTLTIANQGTYTVNANGTVTFDPLASFSGVATAVKYVIADSNGQIDDATITPTVALPPVPTATPESKAVIPGGTVAFTTLTGTGGIATSPTGFNTASTCLITPASSPATCDADGIVTVAGVGTYTLNKTTGVVTLVADAGATQGTKAALTYQVTDIYGQKATSTLTPTIPAPPVGNNDTSSGAFDTNQVISILTNDTATTPAILEPSTVKLCATTSTANASCTLTTLTVPNQGTYTVNSNGTVTFDPLSTFTGTVTVPVKYVAADSSGQIVNATITPTVALPIPPVATAESKAVIPGGTVTFTTLTGTNGLATAQAGFITASTCLITPASSPAACDADGVVTVAGVGTYTLNTTTGVVTLVADPAATQGTKDALTYQVTDTYGQKTTSTLTPVIPAAPVAVNDTPSGGYDATQTISPLTNDTTTPPATFIPSTLKLCPTTSTANSSCNLDSLVVPNEGTYTVNPDGTVTFDPLPTFKGTATPVKYVVTETSNQQTSATITPTVAAPNGPTATAQTKTVNPGDTVAFTTVTGVNGLASAAAGLNTGATCLYTPNTTTCDLDGVVTISGEGTYTLNTSTGVVTFAADPAATAGTKTVIRYEVQDITGQKATSTLTPIIPPPPVANNDTKTGAYDTTQVIPILTNDAPGSGATLVPSSVKLCPTSLILSVTSSCTLTTLTVPDEGTYTVNADGTVTFDPLPTFKGTATPVNYVVADTTGQVDNASITPTVTAPTAPVVTPETKSVIPGGTVAFTTLTGTSGLATSGVGLNTSVTCLIAPATSTCDADGVVTISGEGTYTLNPTTGVVSFVADPAATPGNKTPITYQVQDITGQKSTSTLTPTIPAAPGAVNDTSSGTFDANQVISPLANDTVTSPATFDRSSLKLCATTSTAISSCTLTSLTVPDEGTYTVYPNGTVVFDPLPTFTGPATPVKYVVVDSTGQVTSATITPTVSSPSIPVATPETKSVIPGGTVAFTTITGTNGLASSGVGLDATVTCLITPGTTTCDLDGVVTVSGVGTYTLNTTTGVVTLVADANATPGTKASLTYQVTDIFGQTKTSTLTPVIPAPPVGANDTSSGAYDTNQVISPLTNDTVTSPATLVPSSLKLCATTSTVDVNCNLTSLTIPNEGTYTVNPNGTVTFDPLETFKGTATPVKYVVADSTGQVTHATITSTVIAPAVPVATSETKSVIPGATATFTTITSQGGLATSAAGFIPTATCLITPGSSPATCDADGVVVIAGEGTYTLNTSTGVVTFVADLAATPGSKTSITYQVQDITGQKATATLTPVIPAPPVGVNDIKTGAYDTNQVISPLANDSAISPATLVPSSLKLCPDTTSVIALCALTSLTVPNEGTYTVNQDGTVTFDPLPTFVGNATPVKYVVADSTGQFTSATITSTVAPPRVPIAVNDVSSGPYDANQLINLLLGDTPGEPGLPLLPSSIKICPLNATAPYTSTNCSLVPTQASPLVTADGSYWIDPTTGILTFDPSPTFAGTVTQPLRYVVKDAMNQTVSAAITPSVTAPPIPTATPQTQLLLPGETVSFTNITGTSALATGTLLQTSGATATCLYILNTTTCDADNTVTVIGEGTFVLDPSTGVVTYTADVNATAGTKTPITYRVTDILGRTATSTLTPVIPAATVVALDITRNGWDSIQTISPLANDTPSNGVMLIASTLKLCANGESALAKTCTLTTLIVPGEGTYTVNPDGTVTFDPLPTFAGTATPVNYQVTDSLGRTSGSTITPEVAVPGPPVATPEVKVLTPGATAIFTNVIGTNALAIGVALQTGPTNGPCLIDPITNLCGTTVTIANEGTWTINQTTGVVTFASLSTIAVGTHTSVTYRVTDVLGTTVTSTLTPIVPEVPAVSNDEKVSGWDTNQTFSPFANDKFDSVAPVVVSSLKLCGPGEVIGSCTRTVLSIENEGTYTVNIDGTVTFDPLPTFHGTATPVTYQAFDIAGQLLHATITPIVTAPPIPVATTDEISGKKGRSVVFSPWLNDLPGTAPEGFTGTIKLVPSSIRLCGFDQTAPNCTLTKLTTADGKYTVDIKTGKVTFVPRTGFSGLVTQPVTYQISNDWKGPSGVGISTGQLIANIGAGTLPTTGFDFGVVFVMGGLTMGAGVGLWRISTGRKRGKYHLPRWLNEIDGE